MNHALSIFKYILFTSIFVSVQSCYVNFDDDGMGCENGHGPIVTESRTLPEYSRITNAIGANITLRQDIDQEFRISSQKNILNGITTRVIDGELVIDYNGCFSNASIDIFIANPEIAAVHNIGSGDIYGDNPWQTNQLELRITGSGNIDVEFSADLVTSEITGSGSMELYGLVNESRIRVLGSGNIFAFNLESIDQDIRISGSGNCEVFAQEVLDVTISGSGNVFYKGNPTVSANISGSGNVMEAN
jgi:hypothetical protein